MFHRYSGTVFAVVLWALLGTGTGSAMGQDAPAADNLLKAVTGIAGKPDPRVLAVEGERKLLATLKAAELEKAQREYIGNVLTVGPQLISEFKVDDALAILQPAVPVAKKTSTSAETGVERVLARAKATKAMVTRIMPGLRGLAKDPENKAHVQMVVEALVVEGERNELALKVAQEGKADELVTKVKNVIGIWREGSSPMEENVATGDWMVDIAKRTPAIKDRAHNKAYAAYVLALSDPSVPHDVRKRVYKVVKTFSAIPIQPGNAADAGLLKVDVSVSGNAQVDALLEGLEAQLVPVNRIWEPEQVKGVSDLMVRTLVGKAGLTFRGQVSQVAMDPNAPSGGKDMWRRTIKLTNRFGTDTYVVFYLSKKSQMITLGLGETVVVTGDVMKAWASKNQLGIRLEEAKIQEVVRAAK